MTKVEEIVSEQRVHDRDHMREVLNELLEWAAGVCESDTRQWLGEPPSAQFLAAKRIREGMSK